MPAFAPGPQRGAVSIDLATLLAAITIAAASMALPILFVALRAGGHQGLTLWGAGLVLNTLSYPVFGLRAFGWYGSSIALTNLLTGLTLVAHTLAITAFQYGRARPLPRWLVWLPLLVNMLVVLVFLHDDPWRNVLVAAAQGVMAAVLLREAWAPPDRAAPDGAAGADRRRQHAAGHPGLAHRADGAGP
jgi:hypothetical protein